MTNNTPITTNNDFPPFHRRDKREKARGRYPFSKRYRGGCPTAERVKMLEKHTRRNRQRAKDRDAKSSLCTTSFDEDYPDLVQEYQDEEMMELVMALGFIGNPANPPHFWANRPSWVNSPLSCIATTDGLYQCGCAF
tara:strand:- start:164 stop:574 length:411 start_codon:yes stop_codon:yes gene_type:complete